jgi:hypothetical protein
MGASLFLSCEDFAMRTPLRLTLLALVLSTVTLAGCSYQPARIQTKPLIEIDGARDYRHYRGDDRRYRHRDRHYREEQYYYRDDRRHRGGFCPPGLRKQGRC